MTDQMLWPLCERQAAQTHCFVSNCLDHAFSGIRTGVQNKRVSWWSAFEKSQGKSPCTKSITVKMPCHNLVSRHPTFFSISFDQFTYLWFSASAVTWHLASFFKGSSIHSTVLDTLHWFVIYLVQVCRPSLRVPPTLLDRAHGSISIPVVLVDFWEWNLFWGVKLKCQGWPWWPCLAFLEVRVYSMTFKVPDDPFIFFVMW